MCSLEKYLMFSLILKQLNRRTVEYSFFNLLKNSNSICWRVSTQISLRRVGIFHSSQTKFFQTQHFKVSLISLENLRKIKFSNHIINMTNVWSNEYSHHVYIGKTVLLHVVRSNGTLNTWSVLTRLITDTWNVRF